MNALRCLLLLLGFALAHAVTAQEPREAPPAPPDEAAEPAPPPPSEADRRRAGGTDDVFIPSEELAADEEATFPVDI